MKSTAARVHDTTSARWQGRVLNISNSLFYELAPAGTNVLSRRRPRPQRVGSAILPCVNWSLPERPTGLGSKQDGCVHVARTPYRHSERCRFGHHIGGVFGFVTFHAG